MAYSTVRIKDLSPIWLAKTKLGLDKSVLKMAVDCHRVATTLAPVETGNLVGSGKINRKGNAHYSVSFGGGRVRYARRRHFENRKNPQTLKYLDRAGKSVTRSNILRYL